ncbi:MAG: hypothetical protein AAF621_07875, partial [Pseudomonadota bacterium]
FLYQRLSNVQSTPQYPHLIYCEQNVMYVYQNFRDMTSLGKHEDTRLSYSKLSLDYPFLEAGKKQLSPKFVSSGGWRSIKEITFRGLIRVLTDKNWLKLPDNRLIYHNKEALYHALHYMHYNDDLSSENSDLIKKLCGKYRTFNVALMNNSTIVKGTMDLIYCDLTGAISVVHDVSHFAKYKTEIIYKGTATLLGNKHLMIRACNKDIIENIYAYVWQCDDDGIVLEGISSMYILSQRVGVMRRIYIDNHLDADPLPDQANVVFDINDNLLPPEYAERVNQKDENFVKFNIDGAIYDNS